MRAGSWLLAPGCWERPGDESASGRSSSWFFLALSLFFASCNTVAVTASIDLSIATEGGFTGRGVGGVSIRESAIEATTLGTATCSGVLTREEREALAAAIGKTHPSAWQRDYTPRSNPHGYADQVRYTLTLGGRAVSWTDEGRESLPPDIAVLYELAWRVRERICAENQD